MDFYKMKNECVMMNFVHFDTPTFHFLFIVPISNFRLI